MATAPARRILLVDDDPSIVSSLRRALRLEGYEVDSRGHGLEAVEALRQEPWDLVILDIGLPGIDGIEVCRRVRAEETPVSILMLTARDEMADRVLGLDSGADDYLVKPFALDELLARVRAILRRKDLGEGPLDHVLTFADLRMVPATREVRRGDQELQLTATEFQLLQFLLEHPRQVFSRDLLLDRVWGYPGGTETNVVDVYIGYVRSKLGEPRLIQTVRGMGYVLREEG